MSDNWHYVGPLSNRSVTEEPSFEIMFWAEAVSVAACNLCAALVFGASGRRQHRHFHESVGFAVSALEVIGSKSGRMTSDTPGHEELP